MNGTQIKSFLVMTVLAIIGFGPLSLTCLIGLYVVLARPRWFQTVTRKLYGNLSDDAADPPDRFSGTTVTRLKCILCLLVLLVLDIAPVPVTGSIGLYVIALRPAWFQQVVERIYWDLR